ncbi:MAG: glycoside hydrolase family 66 protein [Proteiniphilum sp.]|nr:glycoside hydrolase family 66 protein [Proteiniphilum sp.]
MLKRITTLLLFIPFLFAACEDYYDTENNPVTYGDTYLSIDLRTDKAIYNPGEPVTFTLKEKPSAPLTVRYFHLGELLKEESVNGREWQWTPPSDDFRGYMAALYETGNGQEQLLQTIAVDVSSDWTRFPRYGFLSSYGLLTPAQIEQQIATLSRYRINGLQFYDWMHDHHRPLAGTADNPLESWPDLIGRTNYLSTVEGYIDAAHEKGMKTMFYNLAFGALSNAPSDGVAEEWYLYRDPYHGDKDNHHLDPPFRSSIWLTNPGNSEWQNYLAARHDDVYRVFNFDGFHIDQLGNRGTLYDYDGNTVDLTTTYAPFITAMKQAQPGKQLVMNAVSSYGQDQIAQGETDFLYTEVWGERNSYEDLARVITDNDSRSGGSKRTVLAAYMNYDRSGSTGFLNAPGVLLTNAVIFSFGGAHLELGEHYLANEYFPNNNLQMKSGLKQSLLHYYDFMTAYQNLLRDGGETAQFDVISADGKLNPEKWPASAGSVAVTGKSFLHRDVIHLINFTDAGSMEWRDNDGTRKEPAAVADALLTVKSDRTVKKVWSASPDYQGGAAMSLPFTLEGDNVTFTLPLLKYWDMVVLEYE